MCNVTYQKSWPSRDRFQSIFALEVIEHMIDTDIFLDRCHASLQCEGRLYLSTPNMACLQNRARLAVGKYPHLMEYRNSIHHVRMYTVPTLLKHLREHGFRLLMCKGVTLLPIRAHKLNLFGKVFAKLASKFPSLCSQVFVVAERF